MSQATPPTAPIEAPAEPPLPPTPEPGTWLERLRRSPTPTKPPCDWPPDTLALFAERNRGLIASLSFFTAISVFGGNLPTSSGFRSLLVLYALTNVVVLGAEVVRQFYTQCRRPHPLLVVFVAMSVGLVVALTIYAVPLFARSLGTLVLTWYIAVMVALAAAAMLSQVSLVLAEWRVAIDDTVEQSGLNRLYRLADILARRVIGLISLVVLLLIVIASLLADPTGVFTPPTPAPQVVIVATPVATPTPPATSTPRPATVTPVIMPTEAPA